MYRKDLIPMLLGRALSIREIARMVDQPVNDTKDDIEHLIKSLKHSEYSVQMEAAQCKKCGFEFGPDKLTKPSKCPKCHATWLTEPRIEIKRKSESGD